MQKFMEIMAGWLAKQEVTTVLLFLHLATVLGLAWYTIQIGVPLHLQMIQEGYERIETSHEKQLDRVVDLLSAEQRKNKTSPTVFPREKTTSTRSLDYQAVP